MKVANNDTIAGAIKKITRGQTVEVTKKTGAKAVKSLKEAVLELIKEGNQVITIPGLITFSTKVVEEHVARNPKTQEEVVVPTRLRTTVKLSSAFKEKVKELTIKNILKEEEKDLASNVAPLDLGLDIEVELDEDAE